MLKHGEREEFAAVYRSKQPAETLIRKNDIWALAIKHECSSRPVPYTRMANFLATRTLANVCGDKDILRCGSVSFLPSAHQGSELVGLEDDPYVEDVNNANWIEVHYIGDTRTLPQLSHEVGRVANFLGAVGAAEHFPYVVGITHERMARYAARHLDMRLDIADCTTGREQKLYAMHLANAAIRGEEPTPFAPHAVSMPTAELVDRFAA